MESFVAYRLIPLDKKPWLRAIGVEEALWWIIGKAVMMLFKNDMTYAAGALQLRAGQDAFVKAVVHAMSDIFCKENNKTVLLIDAENAFSLTNRKVMLRNMKFLCPLISTYICNCYAAPARLFNFGGGEKCLHKE